MTEIDRQYVKRGLWTNYDKGPVIGQTITTDTRTGSFVVALLAVLSTLGAAHAWHLVTFLIHQARANGLPSDALFRQQQALLRTLPSPSTVVADTIKLWWSWRGNASCKRPFLRSLILVLVAILFTVSAIAASIFSSLVVSGGNVVVLVNSPFCGWVKDERMAPNDLDQSYRDPVRSVSIPYAENCYKNGTRSQLCEVFVRSKVDFSTQRAPCPFESMCELGDAISNDSGLVDVNRLFGLNLPSSSRVQFRKKTTCQILPTDGYHRFIGPNESYQLPDGTETVFLKPMLILQYGDATGSLGNMTHWLDMRKVNSSDTYNQANFVHYTSPNGPMSPFNTSFVSPIPELQRNDGDLKVNIVGFNRKAYSKPVEDPFFKAHTRITEFANATADEPYISDFPAGALGCLLQYQFCYARDSKDRVCTGLSGLSSEVTQAVFPDANELQLAVLRLIMSSNYAFDHTFTGEALLAGSIKAKTNETLPELPDDQWIKELVWAESKVWAALQVSIADYAIGPTVRDRGVGLNEFIAPVTSGEKQLCGLQKMKHSGDFANIYLFGLIFIITTSVLFMIVDICVLKFLIYLSKVRTALGPRVDRWIQDGAWQLQRRAYESQGHRNWTNIEKDIPQTRDQKLFLDLPILKVTDRNEPSEVGLLLSMPSFMRSQWELAQQPVLKPRWSLKRLGKLFGRNSVREIEISKPIH